MSRKGNSRHVKRLAASQYAGAKRKEAAYLAKPTPGRHTLEQNATLLSIIRDMLHIANTEKEAELPVRAGSFKVNGRIVKDIKYPIGYGDVIQILPLGKFYGIGINKQGKITVKEVKEAQGRTAKIIGKYVAKGKKIMLRLNDGTVVGFEKPANVNDSVRISLDNKIDGILKLQEGARCEVFKGAHAAETGTITGLTNGTAQISAKARIKSSSGTFETLVENIIVTGE